MYDKIYFNLPVSFQNIAVSLKGWRINKKRYGVEFYSALEELESNYFDSSVDLKKYQASKFEHCIESIHSNKLALKRACFLYEDFVNIKSLDDLYDLQPLSKMKVKEALINYPIVRSKKNIIAHTSGTTGSGLVFPVSKNADAYQWAVWWRYRRLHGITLNTICGYFGGRSIVPPNETTQFYRFNSAANQVMFSAYHLNKDTLHKYVDAVRSKNTSWLHGYPSLISYFASLCIDHDIDLSSIIKIVTIGAESLLPHQKSVIERAFNCPVRQHYGLAEGVANISENVKGELVVDEDFSIVEFDDSSHHSGNYRVLGSSLYNIDLPLFRYDTGDTVSSYEKKENGTRVVKDIDGRKEDFVILNDGSKVGRLDHIFKDITEVLEAQITQTVIGEIQVNIVRSPRYTNNTEVKISEEIQSRLRDMKFTFVYMDKIPRTSNGKLRFVVSNLKQ